MAVSRGLAINTDLIVTQNESLGLKKVPCVSAGQVDFSGQVTCTCKLPVRVQAGHPLKKSLTLLSPNIQIQILHTSVHTLPYRISRENLIKDQSISPLLIILLILLTLSLGNVLL